MRNCVVVAVMLTFASAGIRAGDGLDFKVGDKLAARYEHGAKWVRPIFWPVHAPSGAILTANGPKDHPHHKSIWFCHGDVIPEGIELKNKIKGIAGVDFWSERKGQGRLVCAKEWLVKEQGNQRWLTTKNEWRTGDNTKIIDETRTIEFHDLGKAWLIVLDTDLHASVCPITFGDTKEGAIALRVNELLKATKGGTIENADGKKGEKECRGQKSVWCDYSGTIDGKTVGIAIFDDPKNPYPACWHVRDYGLMAANPFAR